MFSIVPMAHRLNTTVTVTHFLRSYGSDLDHFTEITLLARPWQTPGEEKNFLLAYLRAAYDDRLENVYP